MQSLPIGALYVCLFTTLVISPDAICQENRTLDCDSVFRPDFSIADLHALFGAENVIADDIPVGEGTVELGTVIFPDSPQERVEILWKDAKLRQSPRTVGIVGDESSWATNHGVTLGVDLKTLERINGAPFMLAGFGWDYGGTVTDWSGGVLENLAEDCRVLIRLAPEAKYLDPQWSGTYEPVTGDRQFRSDHPLMQQLNPKVYALVLRY